MEKKPNKKMSSEKKQCYQAPVISAVEVEIEYSIAQASVAGNMQESKSVDNQTVDLEW